METNNIRQPEDLLADESFLAWYHQTDEGLRKGWQDWMDQDVSHRSIADEAVRLLEQLSVPEILVPELQVTEAEDRLMRRIGELTGDKTPGTPVLALHQGHRGRWIAAASVAVILVAAGLVWKKWESKPSVVTPYGKISSVVLPDGTEITLNAHSRLDYGKDWKAGRDREVWLTGEALFHVTKKPLHDRFIVHTDHFDVIVTGTIFNVVNIPDENQGGVLLKEGSVTIREENGQELKMVPGDYVRLKDNRLLKQDTNQDDITAWTENKVDFDNTSFSEVIKMIQLHYGVKVEVSDPRLLSINLNGIFPNDNLDVLLKALEATKEFKVTKDGDKVIIQSPL